MKDNTNDVTDEEVDESIPEEPVTFSPNAVTISGTYLQVNLYISFFLQNSFKLYLKGHEISKGMYEIVALPKIQTKYLIDFCPGRLCRLGMLV